MKRCVLILLSMMLVVGMFSGCDLRKVKEGQIVFSLEETQENECTWEYFVDPQGMIEKVRDEIYEKDGVLLHEWIFEGVEEGEVGLTFQYSKAGEDPLRTVHYICFVDENLHVSLMETEDSALMAGTAEDELLLQCISAVISLQFEKGMDYPTRTVSQEYAKAFLSCFANLFYGETAEENGIVLETETVEEVLNIAFGNRFGTETLVLDGNEVSLHDGCYYIKGQDHAWVDTILLDEELRYVFTVMGETESVDGTAQVTVKETTHNRVGLTLTSITAQKSE